MHEHRRASSRLAVVAGLSLLVSPLAVSMPASAVEGSSYAAWTVAGANPSWSGTMSSGAAGVSASFTTNSNTPDLPSGAGQFLNEGSPFGAVFGSSQNVPYLGFGNAASLATSTTTFTFPNATPTTGWGLALGDIDSETIQISATDGGGNPVAASALGFQSTFNYCANPPVPSQCSGGPPYTDVPTWTEATGTLAGNGPASSGAAAWFRPNVALGTITFVYDDLVGTPRAQLWFAALTASVSGTVEIQDPGGPPEPAPGVVVELHEPGGDPIVDDLGDPVTATTALDGSYEFPTVVQGEFDVVVVPLPDTDVVGDGTLTVDLVDGDVTGVAFLLQRQVSPPTTTTVPPTTTTTPAGAPPAAPPAIPIRSEPRFTG